MQKVTPISTCILSMDDLRKLYDQLSDSLIIIADKEVNSLKKPPEVSFEDFEGHKAWLRSQYRISVIIIGGNGEFLYEENNSIFNSHQLPNTINRVFLSSKSFYRFNTQKDPADWFELTLDFSKPPLLDWVNNVSSPTPNESNLIVSGQDDTWVSGVVRKVEQKIQAHKTHRNFLHAPFIYDAGLLIFGLPAAFSITSLASIYIYSQMSGTFLVFAAHAYVFIATLLSYRTLFGYTKWAFPKIEHNMSNASKHRKLWGGIIGTIALTTLTAAIHKYFLGW